MLYDVRQTTTYLYRAPVATSRHAIRMQPLSRSGQRVVASSVAIEPVPADRHDAVDFFGNAVSSVLITDLHTQLSIVTRARIDVERGALPANRPAPSWEEASAGAVLSRDLGAQSPVHFIYPSPLVPIWEPVGAYCQTSFTAGRSIIEASLDLGRRIQADFRYDATATDVTTPVAQSFTARAGVCQDFAHIMLCGLRTIGVPAAYVSGYLRTEPPPGQPRLLGADAMHAWVEIWCGEEMGWLGFDPTNGVEARDNHIILAVGRDYSDVSPVIGTLRSHGDHTLSVAVDVIEVEG